MSNPLYTQFQSQTQSTPMAQMIQRFNQFCQNFRGDPKQQVQYLLNSGRVSQAQYNQAVQMANQLQRLLK